MTPRPRLRLGKINKGLEQPAPYVQIANDLRRAIAAGTYVPDRLPSEAELTEHYDLGLSRTAVINEALRLYAELHNRGLRPR